MDAKKLTNRDLLLIPEGTKVRIKSEVNCHENYKKGGLLVRQRQKEVDDKDRRFGIRVGDGVCFSFRCADYEIIDERFLKSKFYLNKKDINKTKQKQAGKKT